MNTTYRPELSYDGIGINGPEEYRTRVAAFDKQADADKYGPLFAAAPDLLAALQSLIKEPNGVSWRQAHDAIAKATKGIPT